MLYSISNTTQKNKDPLMRSEIKAYGSVGKPFCVQLDSEPQAWWLVPDGCDNGISLPLEYLGSDGDKYFYNGNVDLISYLEGEGYSIPKGRYKFKIVSGGYDNSEDRLDVKTSGGECYAPSTQSYGEWIINYDYTLGMFFQFNILSDNIELVASNNNYRIKITGSSLSFTKELSGVETDLLTANSLLYLSDTGRCEMKIFRNNILNEFITGPIGTWAIYINDVLVLNDIGNDFFTDNIITTSNYINYSVAITTPISGLYYINSIMPSDFISTLDSFKITVVNDYITGGTNKYTDLFILDSSEPVTDGIGEFSDDYSNDYAI